MSDKNSWSLETFRNNKKKKEFLSFFIGSIMLFIVALAGFGIAASAETKGGVGGGLFLGTGGIIGGILCMIEADEFLTLKKYEEICNPDFFIVYNDMKIPDTYRAYDSEINVELDVDEREIARKLQQSNYNGMFLKANTAPTSTGGTYDAYFVPSDAKGVLTKSNETDPNKKANRLYIIRKGDRAIRVIDEESRSPIPKSISTTPPPCGNPPVEEAI